MTERRTEKCEYLVDNNSCKAVTSDKEGRMIREEWCPHIFKYGCCYRCVRRKVCDISCTYLGGQSDALNGSQMLVDIDQKTQLKLRVHVLEAISLKMGLDLPISESDCPIKERREISAIVDMLHKRDANMKRLHDLKRKRDWTAPDSQKWIWNDQIRELEDENSRVMAKADQKVSTLADSIRNNLLATRQINFQGFIDALKMKGIVLEKLECPHCGGVLKVAEVPRNAQMLQCRYCGRSILAVNLYEKFKEILRG